MPQAPSQDEVLGYFDKLSNWGRWGKDDILGTLNLITDEKRRQAASLVRDGVSVSCSKVIPRVAPLTPSVVHNHMIQSGERYALGDNGEGMELGGQRIAPIQWAAENLSFAFHGGVFTHLDTLAHVFWNAKFYNGYPAESVKAHEGATIEGVDRAVKDGILSKGVLLDMARVKGKTYLTGDDPVFPEDLEEAERQQGVRVEEGDILLLRTGILAHTAELQAQDPMAEAPQMHGGYHVACTPWFRERGVSVIGSDVVNETIPHGYFETSLPVHQVAIVAMGLRLIDNCDLERLGEACAQRNRWEFMLSVNPLRIENGTGSPVNPIATL